MVLVFSFPLRNARVEDETEGAAGPTAQIVCPTCIARAYSVYRRNTRWLSLYSIPLLPVKKYEPYLACGVCESPLAQGAGAEQISQCSFCTSVVPQTYKFCPKCGAPLKRGAAGAR